MNILFTVDKNFAQQLATCVCSICENNTNCDQIRFFVIGQDIDPADIDRIKTLVDHYGRKIEFYDIASALCEFEGIDTWGWNEIILARLLMARFLPEDVDKVLYLDGDTLVIGSLDELWNTDLSDYVLAAVAEPTIDHKRKQTLGLKAEEKYINSGVLLVNLKKWREEDVESRLISYCVDNADILFASDQDALNVVLKDEILFLPPKYNFCNTFYIYPYKSVAKMIESDYYSQEEYAEIVAHPVIIHFLGEDRPWREGSTHHYRNNYYYYRDKTPFAGADLEKGWKPYYSAWSVFNMVMTPFPMMRWRIINTLIPTVKRIYKSRQKNDASQDDR